MSNTFIWPVDRTRSDATSLGQSGAESDVNKGVLRIPYCSSSSITGTSLLDGLVSYLGHLLGESYSAAELLFIRDYTSKKSCVVIEKFSNINCTV